MIKQNTVTIEEARQVLGTVAKEMSDGQITLRLAVMNDLVNGWLDMYEKKIYGGKTLNQLLTFQK